MSDTIIILSKEDIDFLIKDGTREDWTNATYTTRAISDLLNIPEYVLENSLKKMMTYLPELEISEKDKTYRNPETKRICTYRTLDLKAFVTLLVSSKGKKSKQVMIPILDKFFEIFVVTSQL